MRSPIQPKEPALQDFEPMPFGKFKDKLMQDVPATYLLWLWDEFCSNELVDNYLHNNLHALIQECPDRIVRRKVTDVNPKLGVKKDSTHLKDKEFQEKKKWEKPDGTTHGVYKPNVQPPKAKGHNFPEDPPLNFSDTNTHEDELPGELN